MNTSESQKNSDRAALKPFFPHILREGDRIPDSLIRAEILRIGSDDDELVIEYRPAGKSISRRISLGYGDQGVWINSDDPMGVPGC